MKDLTSYAQAEIILALHFKLLQAPNQHTQTALNEFQAALAPASVQASVPPSPQETNVEVL